MIIRWLRKFFSWLAGEKPASEQKSSAPTDLPLHFDSKGTSVKAAQQRLKDLGYTLDVEGEYGPETRAAVLEFQAYNSVGKTGVIGPQTWAALFSTEAKGPTKPTGKAAEGAEIAYRECKKTLSWTGMDCEAEKYLAPMRPALGLPVGRFSWCGAFVTWCMRQAKVEIPTVMSGNLTCAYVPAWEVWAKKRGIYFDAKNHNFNPVKGDVVTFDWDDDGIADHIGIVYDYTPGSHLVTTCEGNTSNASNSNGNSTAIRVRSWGNIRGFIRLS